MIPKRQTYIVLPLFKRFLFTLKKMMILFIHFLGYVSRVKNRKGPQIKLPVPDLYLVAKNGDDQFKCTTCGHCESICPTRCIELILPLGKSIPSLPQSFFFDAKSCISCFLCVDVCPENAISFSFRSDKAILNDFSQGAIDSTK